jgi:Zn-dependent metalloprotease
MNKYPCICHFVPDIMLKELHKQGYDIETEQAKMDDSFRLRRQGMMTLMRAMPAIGNNERQVYDSQNTGSNRLKLVRSEQDAPTKDPEIDAAFDNAGIVRDYFKTVLAWESVDNNGMDLVINVNYLVKYNNAFWDGEQMSFGDGDGVNFKGFVYALDVTAHELAHGLVQFTANLEYKGQSGALNEHFADVFGTAIKQWHFKQTEKTGNWLIGESCLTGKLAGKAIRSMKAPADPTVVMYPQPDSMAKIFKGTADNGGVHINSGIPNRAFYLVAMEIGTQNATLLWFETLKTLKPTAKFKDLYSRLKKKTAELVKSNKMPQNTQAALEKAFKEVGILK